MARTTNFAKMLRKKLAADPRLAAAVARESFKLDMAQKIFAARTEAGLTQKQLADRIGTSQSVIARMEAADYDGHSLKMLTKIAGALSLHLRVEFDSMPFQSTAVK
jgi:ribosome-binding protein aMBF1 (putative translation factor)